MSDRMVVEKRYRVALAAGLAVVVALQAALFAWNGPGEPEGAASERTVAQLVDLPESDAPLEDVSEAVTPEPAADLAPNPGVTRLAAIPSVPRLTAAMNDAVQPLMFMETLEEPEAEENPAVSYASVSDFLVDATASPQPLRPIDDRPVSVLAAIGGSGRGMGIGGDGPHCAPGRPGMFRRSPIVSGAPSLLRSPRM